MPAELRIVEKNPRTEAEDLLSQIVPMLQAVERTRARLRALQANVARQLATERSVAFIREEQLRQEFTAKE